tara:strand:- start:319 stop:1737 length:1419 start_codon:yes stop_codon:yes gene_type:complete
LSKINQQENFKSNFGYCLRSSSIFFIPQEPVKTLFIFGDYWKFKNNLEVFVLASYRDMDGNLVKRVKVNFIDKMVVELECPQGLFGSCEIEAFSTKDLKIPYSAIMAVYESKESISMVHSYSRVYSQQEIEDKKIIIDGKEGCWNLRDNDEVESFAVLHNGFNTLKEQEIQISIQNHKGEKRSVKNKLKELKPYETFLIYPNLYFDDLSEFLDGQEGSASINFHLATSFTRLLICWQKKNKTELQVTHSNFNYSLHETDLIDCEYNYGHMIIPRLEDSKDLYAIIYPEKSPGKYIVSSQNIKIKHVYKNLEIFKVNNQNLKFERQDGNLPSRLVTALKIESKKQSVLPCECSLGIIHKLRPEKRFHWGIFSQKFKSKIIITAIEDIYGKPKQTNLCLRVYSQKTARIIETNLFWNKISKDGINASIELSKYFKKSDIDFENYMYFSIFSHYGGFFIYTTMEKRKSFTLEHSF